MAITVNRPAVTATPAGSLGCEQFQTAYVVRDLDEAIETFGKHYGVKDFTRLPMPPMEGGASMRIGLAWSGGQQIELIEAKGPGLELYTDWMEDGRAIKHHHFGYFIHNDEEWAELEKKLAAEGRHSRPIATQLVPASTFHEAEEYHQQYFAKRGIASCHI